MIPITATCLVLLYLKAALAAEPVEVRRKKVYINQELLNNHWGQSLDPHILPILVLRP